MKLFSSDDRLSWGRAWLCVLINLVATPGLGTLMARRIVTGCCQLVLAVAGSGLLVVGLCESFYNMSLEALGEAPPQGSIIWMWNWGGILFTVSWVWTLISSLGILFQARRENRTRANVPPILKP